MHNRDFQFLLPGINRVYAPIYLAEACNFGPVWKHVSIVHREAPTSLTTDPVLDELLERDELPKPEPNRVIAVAADPLRIWNYWDASSASPKFKDDKFAPFVCGALVVKSPFCYSQVVTDPMKNTDAPKQVALSDLDHVVTTDPWTTAFSVTMSDRARLSANVDCVDRGRIGMVKELAECIADRNSEDRKIGWIGASPTCSPPTTENPFLVTAIMTTKDRWDTQQELMRELLGSIELAVGYMRSNPAWAASKLAQLAERIHDSVFGEHFKQQKEIERWINNWCSDSHSVFNFNKGLAIDKTHFEHAVTKKVAAWKHAAKVSPAEWGELYEQATKLSSQKDALWNAAFAPPLLPLTSHPKLSREWLPTNGWDKKEHVILSWMEIGNLGLAFAGSMAGCLLALMVNLPDDWPPLPGLQWVANCHRALWQWLPGSEWGLSWRILGCVVVGMVGYSCGKQFYHFWRRLDELAWYRRTNWRWKGRVLWCLTAGGLILFSFVILAANVSDAWASVMASSMILVSILATRSGAKGETDRLRNRIKRAVKKLCAFDYALLALGRERSAIPVKPLNFTARGLGLIVRGHSALRQLFIRFERDSSGHEQNLESSLTAGQKAAYSELDRLHGKLDRKSVV